MDQSFIWCDFRRFFPNRLLVSYFGFQSLRVWLACGFSDFGHWDHLHQRKPGAWVTEELPLVLLSIWLPAIIFHFCVLPSSQLHFQNSKSLARSHWLQLISKLWMQLFPIFWQSQGFGLSSGWNENFVKDVKKRYTLGAHRCPSIYYYSVHCGKKYSWAFCM